MTALEAHVQTVLRQEEVSPDAPPVVEPVGGGSQTGWTRTLGRILIVTALVTIWIVSYLVVLSRFPEARAQKGLYAELRSELAGFTAPSAEPVDAGRPVALINAPAAGIHHLVVVEGTAPAQLQNGPGHLRSSALPGQDGISVLMGRSLSFGAPFAGVHQLRPGDMISIETAQGRFHYRVVDRRSTGGVTQVPDTTAAALTLVTSGGTGWLKALTPSSALYVDAVLTGAAQPRNGTSPAVSSDELPMHGDHTFPTLVTLALLLLLAVLVLVALTWARARWSARLAYVVAVPVVLASLWVVSDVAVRLLPNLM